MNFKFPLLRTIRILLFPVSLVYFLVIWFRNFLFNKKILRSVSFNLPIICVGNIAAGGTGKSPMVEYLVRLLKDEFKIATLSRGYKRKTKGYALAATGTTALEIGDEPMQFHLKFPEVPVAVGEERVVAIPQILHDKPGTQAIILDDALQHRSVNAGLNIVLTDYNNLFTRDWYLPTGDLRDVRSAYKRAGIIVVTKCREALAEADKLSVIDEIAPLPYQQIFFSSIRYGRPYHIVHHDNLLPDTETEVLLITGIANPKPLEKFLAEKVKAFHQQTYSDHYIFTIDDLKEMIKRFNHIDAAKKMILTTEKDAVRLVKFETELRDMPFYVIPIEQSFLFGEGAKFDESIISFIRQFKQTS